MTTRPAQLKSPTSADDDRHPATSTATRPGHGAPKSVAEGVLSALRPDPHPHTGPVPIAWLHVRAPGRGAVPTAQSVCTCGRDHHAIGHKRVAALITDHTDHRETCPLRTTADEGRAAA